MHLVSRLRRALAMMTILLGLLAGLGVASANAAWGFPPTGGARGPAGGAAPPPARPPPDPPGGGGSSDPSRS